jgi:HEAT repeat protein
MSPLRKPSTDVPQQHRAELAEVAEQERPFDALLLALVDEDPELRRRAVPALAEHRSALPGLARRVGAEPDLSVRATLCTHLARHDLPEVVDGLIGYLASDDAGLRVAVAGVLSRTTAATGARIPGLLADPDPDVRILTVMVLGGMRSPKVKGWLTELVGTDPDPNVTAAAIGELAPLLDSVDDRVLSAARERFPDDPFIAFAVARALVLLEGERT